MGMISEFKAFAMRGNVLDMAVGIIIGGAFGTIVKSLVEDVIMPPIGIAMGKVDFSNLKYKIADKVEASEGVEAAEAVYISYGNFINQVITFLIVAFAVFMLVKGMNAAMKKEEEKPAPPKPTKDQELLTEIRDALKKA